MSRESRTLKQIDANKLDLEVFRVARRVEEFAAKYRDQDVDDMATTIEAMRRRVRGHMHPKDREATA